MMVLDSIDEVVEHFYRPVVAVGNFDGVHLGHRAIILKAAEQAKALNCPGIIVTFDPHPQLVIGRHASFFLLTSLDEKLHLLSAYPIDAVLVIPFTLEFAHTEPEDFVRNVYVERLHIREIIVGHSHAFGRLGRGNTALLQTLGRQSGFQVHVVPPLTIASEEVNSSRIRKLITQGQIRQATALLGHPYRLSGVVVYGAGRGRQLDFPTANLDFQTPQALLPKRGVYAVRVKLAESWRPAVMNIGVRPTFGTGQESCEVHIIDFDGDIYDQKLAIEFVDRLRDETRFPSVEALKTQIARDVDSAREMLTSGGE